ncbi:MAG: hypothetical protein AABZ57_04545, partial [Candidatus Margulisiibacteriota bacterium]
LAGDFNYTSFGCIIPMPKGVIGLGVMWKGSGGFYTTTREASGRIGSKEAFDYSGNTLFFTYAGRINEQLKFGSRFRYEGETAQGVTGASGSQIVLDAGLLYDRSTDLSVGLSVSNMLNGRMLWSNGYADEPSREIKLGASYRPRNNMEILLDVINSQSAPTLIKAGLEFRPAPMFSLRGGIEQAPSGGSTAMNYTMGIGITASGFGFDYAYLADGLIPENSSHFVSIRMAFPSLSTEKISNADFGKLLAAWIDSAQRNPAKGQVPEALEKLAAAKKEQVSKLLKEIEEELPQATKEASAGKSKEGNFSQREIAMIKDSLGKVLNYFHFGEYQLAIEECNNVLAIDKNNILAYKRLGSVYYFLGEMDKAKAAWEKAYSLNKKDDKLKNLIDHITTQKSKTR